MYKFDLTREQIYKALYEEVKKDPRFFQVKNVSRVEVKLNLDRNDNGEVDIQGASLFISCK